MHVMTVLGARPQFIKAAPLCFALRDAGVRESLVHTGQHYDDRMSEIFFRELGIPEPTVNLGIGSGGHGQQTGAMLAAIETLLLERKPDLLLVYGDTNSTLAGALAAAKLGVPIAHVEAGLRSFNRTMPEETNRILTDHCADLLFCPTQTAVANLATENLRNGVHLVGDTMYDALLRFAPAAREKSRVLDGLGLSGQDFVLATLHRPYNVDEPNVLSEIFAAFARIGRPVVFPVHPRTLARIRAFGLAAPGNVRTVEPLGYLDMLALLHAAALVMTDSGGVQKEACFAGTPCVTLRPETEWVETVETGWNRLAWGRADDIVTAVEAQSRPPAQPLRAYGDGHAAEKIAAILSARNGSAA
ncbi:UDP-N-acetylglucosamine 2-epimerase homolog [uncultured Alphaproteobacteria bacterium]|uniref:UDP-N-acetylglucosamine 2-epimerase homolog n=1 Tax=uncultured Alphaproteobacteria bacterium TaxID=91750 RepID=A0A212KDS5_9PROT|nr:UDP-N-acetylglucosamine 2-epimerase homolog [uncultured Alphaproteobacteria bacterium]